MDETFAITVLLQGKEYSFDARLVAIGYTHRFIVTINELEVIFEPDEERQYRAILAATDHGSVTDGNRALIKAVGEKIESIH
jgi:hypothetical protein